MASPSSLTTAICDHSRIQNIRKWMLEIIDGVAFFTHSRYYPSRSCRHFSTASDGFALGTLLWECCYFNCREVALLPIHSATYFWLVLMITPKIFQLLPFLRQCWNRSNMLDFTLVMLMFNVYCKSTLT